MIFFKFRIFLEQDQFSEYFIQQFFIGLIVLFVFFQFPIGLVAIKFMKIGTWKFREAVLKNLFKIGKGGQSFEIHVPLSHHVSMHYGMNIPAFHAVDAWRDFEEHGDVLKRPFFIDRDIAVEFIRRAWEDSSEFVRHLRLVIPVYVFDVDLLWFFVLFNLLSILIFHSQFWKLEEVAKIWKQNESVVADHCQVFDDFRKLLLLDI